MAEDIKMAEKQYRISSQKELRIDAGDEETVVILIAGKADILGDELKPHTRYSFSNKSFAVFAHVDSIVDIIGTASRYMSPTPNLSMVACINLYAALTKHVAMIVGPANSGKTTMCTTLLNLAMRDGFRPLFIDLNVAFNSIAALPGCIGCTIPNKPSFGNFDDFNESTLLLHFGRTSVGKDTPFFLAQCAELNDIISLRKKDKGNTMVIIRAPSLANIENKARFVLDLERIFKIDRLVIVGDEQLSHTISSSATVVPMATFMGSVEKRNRNIYIAKAIDDYFKDFTPLAHIKYSHANVSLIKVTSSYLPDTVLPIGHKQLSADTFHETPVSQDEKVSLASLVLQTDDGQPCYKQPIMGFVKIVSHDAPHISVSALANLPLPCVLLCHY